MAELYKTLGVQKAASDQEIAKAYRVQALKFHPDRNPDGAEQFKKINYAYTVLSDKVKRAVYDKTGVHGDGPDVADDTAARSADIGQQVADFYRVYRNSPEELADLQAAFIAARGNLGKMFDSHILFDNGVDGEVLRLFGLLEKLVEEDVASEMVQSAFLSTWKKTSAKAQVDKIEKRMLRERAEADQVLSEMHGGAIQPSSAGLGNLQQMILARQQNNRAAELSFLDSLEEKYGNKGSKKKSRKE